MSEQDADKLKRQVEAMTFKQIALLWRWITLEMGGRIFKGEGRLNE